MTAHATARQGVLLAAVRRQSGPWTTARVLRLYRHRGVAAPVRATARRDLADLARRGVLTLRDQPGHRTYTTPTGEDA